MGVRALRITCDAEALDPTYGNPTAAFAKLDKFVLGASRGRFATILLVECYYEPSNPACDVYPDLLNFYEIGRSLADRYRPNSSWLTGQGISNWGIELYQSFNEPHGPCYGQFIATDVYRNSLLNFANGIHSVNTSLKVMPGANWGDYMKAIADLVNNGTLNGIDIHLYGGGNMAYIGDNTCHAQGTIDWAKSAYGITADCDVYLTENNSSQDGNYNQSQDYLAKAALSTWWSSLGYTGNAGTPKGRMALAWNPWNVQTSGYTAGTWEYNELWNLAMAHSRDPWQGNERGRVFQLML